jgi:hypothetical protein
MSGATMALMAAPGMTVKLNPTSDSASGALNNHTFADNTATAEGGTGAYSYSWTAINQVNGSWSFSLPSNQVTAPIVSSVASSTTATADLICTAIDILAGTVVASPPAPYSYTRL